MFYSFLLICHIFISLCKVYSANLGTHRAIYRASLLNYQLLIFTLYITLFRLQKTIKIIIFTKFLITFSKTQNVFFKPYSESPFHREVKYYL